MLEKVHEQTDLGVCALGVQSKKKENIMQYKTIVTWMDRGGFAPNTKRSYESAFRRFMVYVRDDGGKFVNMNPDELVDYQKKSRRSLEEEAEFEIIDELVQPYIKSIENGLRYGTLTQKVNVFNSFFKWNRAKFPEWTISKKPGISKVVGNLSFRDIKNVISNSSPVYRAIFTCMYMGGMDQALSNYWNTELGYKSLEDDIEKNRDIIVIRSPGRKKSKNKLPFYTLIGGDAVDELYNYLENDRKRIIDRFFGGNQEKATAIFYTQIGTPVNEKNLSGYWYRKLVQLGLIVPLKNRNPGNRYGKNLHELRDTFRSKATGICAEERIPPSIFEFMMGHQVDKNLYDKYCDDKVAMKIQYRKAIPYLNIMTSNRALGLYDEEEVEKEREIVRKSAKEKSVEDLRIDNLELQQKYDIMSEKLDALIKEKGSSQ